MVIHPTEAFACHYRPVVVCPSANYGVKSGDYSFLGRSPHFADFLLQLFDVSLLGFPAGFDECLESKRPSMRVLGCAVFPYMVLPHVKSQEVKSPVAFIGFQGVGDPGLAWFHFQSYAL